MREDSRVLEVYIDFIIYSMKDLEQLCIREKELVQKTNLLNRNKNVQLINHEYEQFINRLCLEWVKIYTDSNHLVKSLEKPGVLENSKTIYAVTLPQKCVEQFFFHLHMALRVQMKCNEDQKNLKANYTDFFDTFSFSYVRMYMHDLFTITLEAMKNHVVNVAEQKKQAFVVVNQRFIKDLSIHHRTGDELTDSRIDQILADLKEQKKRKKAELDDDIKNGRVHVTLATYPTPRDLVRGLESRSCEILAETISGSKVLYDTLPELSVISGDDLISTAVDIELHSQIASLPEEKLLIDLKEINAFYLGMFAGYALLNSVPYSPEFLREKFLNTKVQPVVLSSRVMSYIGIDSHSDEAALVRTLVSEMLRLFTSVVMYPRSQNDEDNLTRVMVAIQTAFKLGYNAYFRMKKVVPGYTCEEDQLILNRRFTKDSIQKSNTANSPVSVNNTNKVPDVPSSDRKGADSSRGTKAQEKKYWLDENGKIRCPGDACPKDCDTECPIYAQTMALEKFSKDDYEGAAKLLRIATSIEPSFADAWNNLAACYGLMDDHKNAFAAYQRSYETEPKPNPLYGMAVATKNMKDLDLAKIYANTYINKFGKDDRITALMAELSGDKPAEKMIVEKQQNDSESNTAPAMQDIIHTSSNSMLETHDLSHSMPVNEAIRKGPETTTNNMVDVPQVSNELMRRYGKLMLLLADPDTRDAGYVAMEKLENEFPEAAINIGQHFNGSDQGEAKKHLKIAADAGIAEGQWDYSQLLPHSHILDFSDQCDKEYLRYCLAAAEGGCPDAASEMGNICHRKGFYAESAYWYGMAYALDHADGMVNLCGITKEWQQKGFSKDYAAHIEGYTEDRHATVLILYKMITESLDVKDLDSLMMLALKGENLAGLVEAKIFEQHQKDDSACMVYKALVNENHPYALRCYADMLITGKGTEKDVDAALRLYEQAARSGNAESMFVMGQKAEKEGDKYLAACWFGLAYSRGMEMAGDRLAALADK